MNAISENRTLDALVKLVAQRHIEDGGKAATKSDLLKLIIDEINPDELGILGSLNGTELIEEIKKIDQPAANTFTAKQDIKTEEANKPKKLNGNLTDVNELSYIFGLSDKGLSSQETETLFSGMAGLFKHFNPKQKSRVAKIINEVGKRNNILESKDLEMALYREVLDICLTHKLPRTFKNNPQEVQNLRNKLTRHCHDVFDLCNRLNEMIYIRDVKPRTAQNYINTIDKNEAQITKPIESSEPNLSPDPVQYIDAVKSNTSQTTDEREISVTEQLFFNGNPAEELPAHVLDAIFSDDSFVKKSVTDTLFSKGNPAEELPAHVLDVIFSDENPAKELNEQSVEQSSQSHTILSPQKLKSSKEDEPSPILSLALGGIATLGGFFWGRFSGFSWKNILTSLFGVLMVASGTAGLFTGKKE